MAQLALKGPSVSRALQFVTRSPTRVSVGELSSRLSRRARAPWRVVITALGRAARDEPSDLRLRACISYRNSHFQRLSEFMLTLAGGEYVVAERPRRKTERMDTAS
jgi:hypothetical protein